MTKTAFELGNTAASQGICTISLLENSIEEATMMGAVGNQGFSLGILSSGLFKKALSSKYRNELMCGRFVFLSPFYPEANYSLQNWATVDKYRYCLAEAAIVVGNLSANHAEWRGAMEDFKNGWTPLWIDANLSAFKESSELVMRGARRLPAQPPNVQFRTLFGYEENLDLFARGTC